MFVINVSNGFTVPHQVLKNCFITYIRPNRIDKTSINNNNKVCGSLDVRTSDYHYRTLFGNKRANNTMKWLF